MADSTVGGLPAATLPLTGTDKTIVSRDGVIVNQTSLDNVAFYDSLKNDDVANVNGAYQAWQKLFQVDRGIGFYAGIAFHGDSMADPSSYFGQILVNAVARKIGLGAIFSPRLGYTGNNVAWTLGGGATQPASDFTYLPSAPQINLPVDGFAALPCPSASIASNVANPSGLPSTFGEPATLRSRHVKLSAYYIKQSGAGSFTFIAHQPDVVDPAAVIDPTKTALSSTSNTVGTGGANKTFNVGASAGKTFAAGEYYVIQRVASHTTYMVAQVVSYDDVTGSLVVKSKFSQGTGTFTDWEIIQPTYQPVLIDSSSVSATTLEKVEYTVIGFASRIDAGFYGETGTSLPIGLVWWREKGLLAISSQVGGSQLINQNAFIANSGTLYKALLEEFFVGLVIHSNRVAGENGGFDTPTGTKFQYRRLFDAYDALNAVSPAGTVAPYYGQLVLGEPPNFAGDVDSATINEFLRQECVDRGYAFIDQNRAMGGSLTELQQLGWISSGSGVGNGTHLEAPAWRFQAGLIIRSMGGLNGVATATEIFPVTLDELNRQRFRVGLIDSLRKTVISGVAQSTLDNGSTSGAGYTFTATNLRGFIFTAGGGAGGVVGYSTGTVAYTVTGSSVRTQNHSLAWAFNGYRNMQLQSNVRAFIVFGSNTANLTSFAALASQRCFGLEFALGSDVGSPNGIATEQYRFFYSDGLNAANSIAYGAWRPIAIASTTANSQGFGMAVHWELSTRRFRVYQTIGNQSVAMPDSYVIPAAHPIFTTSCSGPAVQAGVVSIGAGPTTSGANLSIKNLTEISGETIPYFML